MINTITMIEQAEIYWHLTDKCNTGCQYCYKKYQANSNKRTTEEYLTVIEKLQISRYKNAKSIKWKLSGGEPLQFPGLSQLLKKIKSQPSYVRLDTSGGSTWFDLIETKEYVDHYKLTHHHWQNESVLNFIIDFCIENNKKLNVVIPLYPGKIFEDREKIQKLNLSGIDTQELILRDETNPGNYWAGYSKVDINRIFGRPDNWVPEDEPIKKEPVYVDLSKPPADDSPSYTGQGCFAGVDYLYISHKGYTAGSECGGRDIGNVFDAYWVAPDAMFNCCVNYCRFQSDRKKIRVGVTQ